MAYTINLTNGTSLIPGGLSDGTINTTNSSLTLVGRDYAGYGQFLNENFVYLLENFANGTGPANPLKGQLWWDTTNNILRVWSGSSWKISTGATSGPASSPPSDLSALGGDLWFDTTNSQLKVYSGSSWIVVGPTATPATGVTGAFPALMTDTSSGTHIVIQFTVAGIVYAVFSKDTFTSATSGFTTVKAGLNFSTVASPSLVLNTQDVNATASTLAQRDGTGSLNVVNLNASGTVSGATGSFSTLSLTGAGALTGNVSGNVTGTYGTFTSIQTQSINASSGYTGTILTASQPNITGLGNVYNLNTNGTTNLTGLARYNGVEIATLGGSATFSSVNGTPVGNSTPSTGAFTTLTSSSGITPTANATINNGGTSNFWGTTYTSSLAAISANVGTVGAGRITSTGINIGGTLSATTANANAVYAGSFYFANGVPFTTSTYSNANVAAYAVAGIPDVNITNSLAITGTATLNGVGLATLGGSASFSSINGTPIGNATPNTGSFTTLYANYFIANSSIMPGSNVSVNIGSSSTWFNNIYGTAIHAQYADLAERFAADMEYPAGTVVELGGVAEVTKVVEELSENVFGVISTNAGYLMNSRAGTDATHPPIAMSGRVPVRVTGFINKGDRLVSAGNGLARAANKSEITAFNVIGRALGNKSDAGEGIVEAIVKINS